MKLFLWDSVTFNNYHSGGGLVVVANDVKRAEELIQIRNGKDDYVSNKVETVDLTSALVFELVGEYPEAVYPFPDAGCC